MAIETIHKETIVLKIYLCLGWVPPTIQSPERCRAAARRSARPATTGSSSTQRAGASRPHYAGRPTTGGACGALTASSSMASVASTATTTVSGGPRRRFVAAARTASSATAVAAVLHPDASEDGVDGKNDRHNTDDSNEENPMTTKRTTHQTACVWEVAR